jgi:hypothetical protein
MNESTHIIINNTAIPKSYVTDSTSESEFVKTYTGKFDHLSDDDLKFIYSEVKPEVKTTKKG